MMGSNRRTLSAAFAATLVMLGCDIADGQPPQDAARAAVADAKPAFRTTEDPEALALIIAISDYGAPPEEMKNARGQSALAYRPLNADNDVPLIQQGLELHGFEPENIRVVRDEAATREGIVGALDALVEAAGPGDVVVIHYSGHGHQITDDDGPHDELDGLDEVLVPFGAPAEAVPDYDGHMHLRDDVVGEYVQKLRERVGSTGNVTMFLDACFSGTGTRGAEDFRNAPQARGVMVPLGEPHPAAVSATADDPGTRGGPAGDEGSGLEVGSAPATRGAGSARRDRSESELAPFAVVSAARHDEVAHETYGHDGSTYVGSLSFALSQALPRLQEGDTYSTLYSYVVSALNGRVRQTPQLEGDRDAVVFRPEFVRSRAPSVRVAEVRANGDVVLDAGGLVGLNAGSRVVLYPASGDPDEIEPWAHGSVVSATFTRAVVDLDGTPPQAADLREARVFAERLAYGDAAIRVAMGSEVPTATADSLRSLLAGIGMLELVESGGEVVIGTEDVVEGHRPPGERSAKAREYRGTVAAATASDGVALAPPSAPAPQLARRIEDWARNQYLRRLQIEHAGIDVDFDLAVVQWDESLNACTRPDWDAAREHPGYQGGGRWTLAPDTDYVLRVRNNGDRHLYFAVVDLMPPGDTDSLVKPLYPGKSHSAQATELPPGREVQIPDRCFYTEPTNGLETLKLFVSTEPIPINTLIGMRTRSGERGGETTMTATREIHLLVRGSAPEQ